MIDNGFFSGPVLVGISKANADIRRQRWLATNPKTPDAIEDLPGPAFTALVAKTIRDGLFRHEQYGDPAGLKQIEGDGDDHPVSDPVYNRPYINNLLSTEPAAHRSQIKRAPGSDLARPVTPSSSYAKGRGDIAVNRYLDCYVGPVGLDETDPSTTGDYDVEGRLLRAHILLSMLAAYGAELVTSTPSKRQTEQATRLLGHLRDAELSLRSASMIMNLPLREYLVMQGGGSVWTEPGAVPAATDVALPLARLKSGKPAKRTDAKQSGKAATALLPGTPTPADVTTAASEIAAIDSAGQLVAPADRAGKLPFLRWYPYTTRLLRVFQIGVDIAVIDAQQSLNRLSNILAAFSTPTPAAFSAILNDAVVGLGTVQKVELYGTAMRLDGSETLAAHRLSLIGYNGANNGVRGQSANLSDLHGNIDRFRYDIASARQHWRLWDVRLEASCRLLANVAKQTDTGCVPNSEALKSALAAELPPMSETAN